MVVRWYRHGVSVSLRLTTVVTAWSRDDDTRGGWRHKERRKGRQHKEWRVETVRGSSNAWQQCMTAVSGGTCI